MHRGGGGRAWFTLLGRSECVCRSDFHECPHWGYAISCWRDQWQVVSGDRSGFSQLGDCLLEGSVVAVADGECSDFSQPLWGLCHIGYDSARGSLRWGRAPNTHSAVERSQGDKPCQLGTSEARAARA